MKIIILIAIAVVIAFSGILAIIIFIPHNTQEAIIEISQGTTASNIADMLFDKDVIRSKLIFRIYTKLLGSDRKLSYGEFHFREKMSMHAVVRQLEGAKVVLYRVVVIEGLTIRGTASSLANNGFVDFDRFVSLCTDADFAQKLTGLPVATLEGFLYPNTYHYPKRVSEEYIIRTMVNEFFKQLGTIVLKMPEDEEINISDFLKQEYGYDLYELLTLASIVEKEATFEDEKPLIAGVYHNRLKIGKRLQADPTVAYALKKVGIIRRMIYYRDLEIDSPYNTYRNSGLPPAPICSPSITSIKAAIAPEESDYLFFFANNQGRHIFSKTYRDHLSRQRALRRGEDINSFLYLPNEDDILKKNTIGSKKIYSFTGNFIPIREITNNAISEEIFQDS